MAGVPVAVGLGTEMTVALSSGGVVVELVVGVGVGVLSVAGLEGVAVEAVRVGVGGGD